MKKKSNKLAPVCKILPRSIKSLGIDLGFAQQEAIDKWEHIVGNQIGSISKAGYFKFRTLFVNVLNSIWLHQLAFLEDEIINKINTFAGRKLVQKIYFKVGELPQKILTKSTGEDANFLSFTDEIDEKETNIIIKHLKDAELKRLLKRIIMKGKGADKYRRQNIIDNL